MEGCLCGDVLGGHVVVVGVVPVVVGSLCWCLDLGCIWCCSCEGVVSKADGYGCVCEVMPCVSRGSEYEYEEYKYSLHSSVLVM